MSWYSLFETELKATIAAALPELAPNGPDDLFTSVQAARQNLLQAVTSKPDDGGIPLPFGVVRVGKAVPEERRGMHNRAFRMPVTIFVVSKIDGAGYGARAIEDLDTAALAIERTRHTSFMAIESGILDGEEAEGALAVVNAARTNLHVAALTYAPGLLSGEFFL